MPTWEDVVAIGLRYPGVEQATTFRSPSLRVRRKFMCRLRTNPDALVVRVLDLQEAEALTKGQPDVFFTTPHYDGYPYVLARLDVIDVEQLEEVIEDAWRTQAPKTLVRDHDAAQA
jgi:hypothetical protein